MSCGMSRFEANRFAVPAGTIASVTPLPASVSTQRCTIPSPPQTKISSAPSSSARLTRFGRVLALRHLRPERIVDARLLERRGAAPRARRRSSCPRGRSPRPSSLRLLLARSRASAAAMPAARQAKRRCAAVRRSHERPRRARRAGGACRGTCATSATKTGIATASAQIATRGSDVRSARRAGAQARSRARSTPPCARRGSSRSHGRLSSRWTCGAVAVDDERRRPVDARLERRSRRAMNAGEAPLAQHDERRAAARPTTIGITTPPAMIEPTSERR